MDYLTDRLDWILCLILAALGVAIVPWRPMGLDQPSAAALAGALFGAAALLLGNAISRHHARSQAELERIDQAIKLRALIGAELVDVAAGLLEIHGRLSGAIATLLNDGEVAGADLAAFRLRELTYPAGLGADLLLLDRVTVHALATLRAHWSLTRQRLDEIRADARLGLRQARSLSQAIAEDMQRLAVALNYTAPEHQLWHAGQSERVIALLSRAIAAASLHKTEH
ncbi:hypothetical protein [Ralstonia solanacearum]|uniref:hypothetical protein n=1 Tax=Ralstonia solanacearum TaxID=305 RepID=UPI0018D134C5|nr:hypothetical protein [Ralstonia solanacearum]